MTPRHAPLVLATTNRGKAREIAAALDGLPVRVLTLADLGITTVCPEKGLTFAENARAKAEFYGRRTGHPVLAEDSGLEVKALDGTPGVRSARFSGRGTTDARNIRKTLRLLAGVPRDRRRARFVCVMALSGGGRLLKVVRGQVRGTIASAPRGLHGFGYDPIFEYHPLRRTFGELEAEEKNRVSHRGRALAKMKKALPALLHFEESGERVRSTGPRRATRRAKP